MRITEPTLWRIENASKRLLVLLGRKGLRPNNKQIRQYQRDYKGKTMVWDCKKGLWLSADSHKPAVVIYACRY